MEMMEAEWSARRVTRQLGCSDCVVRRCWTNGSERCNLQEDYVLPLTPTHRCLRLEWCRARGNWTAAEWNQVIFSDEPKLNLSSDDNHVRVWRPRGERLHPAFALQRHTAPTAGVMVRGAVAYNTWKPLLLIRGTMTAQWYVQDILQPHVLPLMQRLRGTIFQQGNAQPHTARVSRDCLPTVTILLFCYFPHPIPRFVSNRAYLGSSWVFHEIERTRGNVTANMERNVSRHLTELVCLNTRSDRIVHSR
ncbi:transposable element Tcb1 transposase [Trichonephila clavipes]|nr:transposable element Tcb1 transposase [Trichonephila clavipes]